MLDRFGDRGYLPTVARMLADLLYWQGRYEEIERLCTIGRTATTPDDLVNFVLLDTIEGAMLARRGQHGEGEARARRAVAQAETTDFY